MKAMRNVILGTLAVIVSGLVFTMVLGFDGTRQTLRNQSNGSSMTIVGTSTLHDWTVDVNEFQCDMTMISDLSLMRIEAVTYNGRARGIKSDNNIMNRKIQESLKVNQFPNIRFAVRSSRDVTMTNNRFSGLITGDITIAGVAKRETIRFTGETISANRLRINGSKKLKMTDFGIDPPTAMMGAVKTGDEVTVNFSLVMAVTN